jgi:hypothetical protein
MSTTKNLILAHNCKYAFHDTKGATQCGILRFLPEDVKNPMENVYMEARRALGYEFTQPNGQSLNELAVEFSTGIVYVRVDEYSRLQDYEFSDKRQYPTNGNLKKTLRTAKPDDVYLVYEVNGQKVFAYWKPIPTDPIYVTHTKCNVRFSPPPGAERGMFAAGFILEVHPQTPFRGHPFSRLLSTHGYSEANNKSQMEEMVNALIDAGVSKDRLQNQYDEFQSFRDDEWFKVLNSLQPGHVKSGKKNADDRCPGNLAFAAFVSHQLDINVWIVDEMGYLFPAWLLLSKGSRGGFKANLPTSVDKQSISQFGTALDQQQSQRLVQFRSYYLGVTEKTVGSWDIGKYYTYRAYAALRPLERQCSLSASCGTTLVSLLSVYGLDLNQCAFLAEEWKKQTPPSQCNAESDFSARFVDLMDMAYKATCLTPNLAKGCVEYHPSPRNVKAKDVPFSLNAANISNIMMYPKIPIDVALQSDCNLFTTKLHNTTPLSARFELQNRLLLANHHSPLTKVFTQLNDNEEEVRRCRTKLTTLRAFYGFEPSLILLSVETERAMNKPTFFAAAKEDIYLTQSKDSKDFKNDMEFDLYEIRQAKLSVPSSFMESETQVASAQSPRVNRQQQEKDPEKVTALLENVEDLQPLKRAASHEQSDSGSEAGSDSWSEAGSDSRSESGSDSPSKAESHSRSKARSDSPSNAASDSHSESGFYSDN